MISCAKSPRGWLFTLLATLIGLQLAPSFASANPHYQNLTAEERILWDQHGIDAPSLDLLPGAEARRRGETTTLNVVIVLVDFEDVPADVVAHPPAYYEDLFFSRDTHPTGSVADYFHKVSHGRFELTGIVKGWYRAPRTSDYYTANRGGLGFFPTNAQGLAIDAVQLVNPDINLAHYDNEGPDLIPDSGDDDENVDGFIIIHAGDGREGGSISADNFTAVKWNTVKPVPADGVFVSPFTLNPETGNIGIYIHEIGHLLGLPDLYPTLSSIQGSSFGMGQWSVMAGGFNLEDGVYPCDFDAWSKAQLGFVDVVRVFSNRDDEVIPPVSESGRVYRLWANGNSASEHFLLENRPATGIDRALPGGGLMIYHVDDRVSSNNNPDRYRVAVEQADGLFQLENRFSSASPGDEGDPFKEGQRFGRTTNPSSLSNTGEDSFVSVFNIQGPDATGTMSANLRVEPNAIVDIQGVNLVELEGNGNNLLEAGELVGVEPILSVSREPAFDLKLHLTSLDELGEVLDPVLDVGTVPVNQTVTASAMAVRISEDIPSDPYGLRLNLDVDWRDDMGREVTVELGIGTAVGRTDDFETVDHGWVHQRTRTTSVDQWFYGPGVGTEGSAGFKVGGVLFGFARGIDAYLESPPILLPPHAELVYDQILDVIYNDSSKVDAGGIIELSINGGDWTQATPEGDYPARYFGSNTEWDGRRVFAGSVNPLEFETIRFDLSQFAGSVRVRFRFFSDSPSFIGGGWRIDNVIVRSGMTPVRVLEKEAVLRGQDVALSWKLAAPLPAAIRVVRQGTETVPVTDWQAATASGFALDAGAATELPAEYWLEGRERNGELSRWGPWTVERSQFQTQNLMRLLRNPSRLGSLVQFDRPLEQEQQVQVFDIRGRLVRQEALSMGTSAWEWDGRTSTGNQVRPGIYFLRVVSWDLAPLRIVRLP